MSVFVDRRINNKNKSAVNRRRFIQRFKKQIKQSISEALTHRSIRNIHSGENITIPTKDISEPSFRHTGGGIQHGVHPGNKEFRQGDRIKRPPNSTHGNDSQASNTGEGSDEFAFELSREEFLDLFFEDLALPNLIKKEIAQIPDYKLVHGGYTTQGSPANINVLQSLKNATGRRKALAGSIKKRLKKAQQQLKEANKSLAINDPRIKDLEDKIKRYKNRLNKIPFIDTYDLRYHLRIKHLYPSTQAVMFCLMDVSGSMNEEKKEIAKRFFILLYLFLTKNYQKIDLVFIRHHTSAKEVAEDEFFYSRETGGTVVSSALELMRTIMLERYPISAWNIYAAQASDGDNWNADSPYCQSLLLKNIMPFVQYYAYLEILPRQHQNLWEAYQVVNEQFPNFAMQHITGVDEIYPVLRHLFNKEVK